MLDGKHGPDAVYPLHKNCDQNTFICTMCTDPSHEPSRALVSVATTVRLPHSKASVPFMHKYSRKVCSPVIVDASPWRGKKQSNGGTERNCSRRVSTQSENIWVIPCMGDLNECFVLPRKSFLLALALTWLKGRGARFKFLLIMLRFLFAHCTWEVL